MTEDIKQHPTTHQKSCDESWPASSRRTNASVASTRAVLGAAAAGLLMLRTTVVEEVRRREGRAGTTRRAKACSMHLPVRSGCCWPDAHRPTQQRQHLQLRARTPYPAHNFVRC
jgi:hypothetical protein